MNKAQRALTEARKIAAGDVNWSEFSNALFDPETGILTKAFPLGTPRSAFMKTREYGEIRGLLKEVMDRTGVIEGATPRKSGKFVVRLPCSLHSALEREAQEEGVSLNQLVVAKLAVQLKTVNAPRPARSRWKSN